MKTRSRKFRLLKPLSNLVLLLCLFMLTSTAFAQVNVSGTIVDEKNLPMFGVTVVEKGTTNGVVTDIDGAFSINVRNSGSVLRFTSIGFVAQEVVVGNQTSLSIVMEEDLALLDEVIVTGYGVQRKSDLTGAVSSVSSEDVNRIPISTIDQALQGQAAGVNITARSGRPGAAADIQIRGISSINGTQPLIVIDGIPGGDLNSINPADIASVEVLKDASSAAIYGATGGNGVIIITTKEAQAGKINTTVNMYRGMETAISKIELMNSQEWMRTKEEDRWNRALSPRFRGLESELDRSEMYTSSPDTLQTYDWQDIIFRNALSENYDITVSGGSDVSKTLVSASYSNQEGIVKASGYERFTFRVNAEQKLSERIVLDQRINFINTNEEGIEEWRWHNYYSNPLYNALTMDPAVPAYDSEGTWSRSIFSNVNPMVNLDMTDRLMKNMNLSGNFGATIHLFKGLSYTARFAGNLGLSDYKEYEAIYFATETDNNTVDKLHQEMSRSYSYTVQNMINYNTSIGEHNISVMAGMEANKWWGYNIRGERHDMPSTDPNMLYFDKSLNNENAAQFIRGTGYIGATMAYFGRINYDYASKYLLTLNARRDGSSSFGPSNRWGFFPSASVGWKFSEEAFMQDVDVISFGKLRFGYGQTGSNARSGFPYLAQIESPMQFRYSVDNGTARDGAGPWQIANPEIMWETVIMSNLGLDLTFFNNRVSLTADVFDKVNDGMLMYKEVPRIAGTYNGDYPEVNVGSIRNMGYEITLGARKSEGELKGSVNLNFSGVRNEVLELAQDSMLAGRVHTLQPTNITMIGSPVAQFYGYETEGIFGMDEPYEGEGRNFAFTDQPYVENDGVKRYAQPNAYFGDVRYKDQNDDGKIDNDDRVVLGSPLPKLVYGFSVNLEYKGFDLSAFFNGTYGNKILNGTKQYLYYLQGHANSAKDFNDRFVPYDVYALNEAGEEVLILEANHDAELPRNFSDNYNKLREWHIEDGSYLRLRNLVVGYTVPQSISQRIGLEKLRVYGGARNLFTLTKYTGLSPDVAGKTPESEGLGILELGVDLGVYPVTKMYYFGVNIAF